MQHLVHTALTVKLAFFLTNAFNVLQVGPVLPRNQHAQLRKHCRRLYGIGEGRHGSRGLKQKWTNLGLVQIDQGRRCAFIGTQSSAIAAVVTAAG